MTDDPTNGGLAMGTTATKSMTTEDLLAIPDDGRRRWLIKGELHEELDPGGPEMTTRNRIELRGSASAGG